MQEGTHATQSDANLQKNQHLLVMRYCTALLVFSKSRNKFLRGNCERGQQSRRDRSELSKWGLQSDRVIGGPRLCALICEGTISTIPLGNI